MELAVGLVADGSCPTAQRPKQEGMPWRCDSPGSWALAQDIRPHRERRAPGTRRRSSRPASPGRFPSLLSEEPSAARGAGEQDQDRSFARDLNLDQIVAAVAGDREERDLITMVLFGRLDDAGAVRYRQEVFQDLEDPALFDAVQQFRRADGRGARPPASAGARCSTATSGRAGCWTRRPSTATRCTRWPGTSPRRGSAPAACWPSGSTWLPMRPRPGSPPWPSDTRDRKDALGQIRYCTRIRGDRVEVSRYQDEADYSAAVLKTFERFKQGAVKDYRVHYRTLAGDEPRRRADPRAGGPAVPGRSSPPWRSTAASTPRSSMRASGAPTSELQFYLAYLDYIRPLRAAGLRFCYPEVSASSKEVRAAGTFDLALAHKLVAERKPVVTNEFRLEGRERDLRRDRPQPGRQDHLCPDLRPAPPPGQHRLPGPGQRRPPVPARPHLHPFRAGGGPRRR